MFIFLTVFPNPVISKVPIKRYFNETFSASFQISIVDSVGSVGYNSSRYARKKSLRKQNLPLFSASPGTGTYVVMYQMNLGVILIDTIELEDIGGAVEG